MAHTKLYETITLNQKEGYQRNILRRDIQKTFDNVWISDLQPS